MLPLAAERFPASSDELAAALTAGFAARGVTVKSVRADGAALAALDALAIDLAGAEFSRSFRLSTARSEGAGTVATARFELTGAPLVFETVPLDLLVEAENAELRFAGVPADGALVLTNAASGSAAVTVAQSALESLLQKLAAEAAGKQGLEIKKTKLELTARGPRALSFRCEVTAKMFVMSADLSLSGNLDVDDQLNARLSGLTLGGDAMITKLAAGFVRPHLDKFEGRVFPLLALSLGDLKLHDVEIGTNDGLTVRAKFGRG
jgi:hypothetical protein